MNHDHKIVPSGDFVLLAPVRFSDKTPRPISRHRRPRTLADPKSNPGSDELVREYAER